jgi:hypothetical protein
VVRISVRFALAALLAPFLALGQNAAQINAVKVDVNLATLADLQALPGITPELAQKIVDGKPYSQVSDLHRAGLTDAMIRQIQDLVIFTQVQHEKTGREGGEISSVTVFKLYKCASASTEVKPTEVDVSTAGEQKQATVCLPRMWFNNDGTTFSPTGKIEFSDLVHILDKKPGKHIKIVGLHPDHFNSDDKIWTWSVGSLVASSLRSSSGTHSIEIYSARASKHQLAEWIGSENGEENLTVRTVDLSDTAQKVDTLLLVLPEKKE